MTTIKRRKVLVDRKLQLSVAVSFAFIGLVIVLFHFLIVGVLLWRTQAGEFDVGNLLMLTPLAIAILVALGYLGVLVTHRIAGPAYRLRATLTDYTLGKVDTRAHLRQHDALKDLAETVNQLGERLQQRSTDRAQALTKLRDAIDSKADAKSIAAAIEALEEVDRTDMPV